MANIELRSRFFGDGLVGTVDVPQAPTLSWSEHRALLSGAMDLSATRRALEDLGFEIRSVAPAIERVENRLGLRLDQQAAFLEEQTHLLEDIAQSLRTPARVRAVERLSTVGELLRRKRYDRALSAAEKAIEDDPNNPAAFVAGGWACIGLRDLDRARSMFVEAAQASDGDDRSARTRQVARLTFALNGPNEALSKLDEGVAYAQSPGEHAAVSYDRSVYLADLGDDAAALNCLMTAGRTEPALLFSALADPVLASKAIIVEAASQELKTRQKAVTVLTAQYNELIDRLGEQMASLRDYAQGSRARSRDDGQQAIQGFAEFSDRHLKGQVDLLATATRLLDAKPLLSATQEVTDTLKRIEDYRERVVDLAMRALELERAALDFAAREDAWPTKLRDGTWEITKKQRFGRQIKWRATIDEQGAPVIQPEQS